MIGQGALAALAVAGLIGALSIADPQPQRTAPTHQTCEKRMPQWQSQAIKREMADAAGVRMQDYQLDHIVSLGLCGTNVRSNLCLQPIAEAKEKDRLELQLMRLVRSGRLELPRAQTMLREDWRGSYKQIFGEPAYAAEKGRAERRAQGRDQGQQCD